MTPTPAKEEKPKMRTLWKAKLRIGTNAKGGQDFLFRAGDDCVVATAMAQKLVESSTAAEMVGAELIGVERVARLWN